jgi:hypothetical protein
MKHLTTTKAVIDALGGTRAVATIVKVKTSSVVSNWRARNCFPSRTYPVLKAALKDRGFVASERLWRMMEIESTQL